MSQIALRTLLAASCLTTFAAAQTSRPAREREADLPLPPPPVEPMAIEHREAFVNEVYWPDADGMHINAHGGGVLFHDGVYYLYGECRGKRTAETRWPSSPGVSVYTSTDLYNWKNAGIAFAPVSDDSSPVAIGCNIERPKVIFNAHTGKFVMWFHLELKGRSYGAAFAAVAVSDSSTGPFKFVRAERPNKGKWPVDLPEADRSPYSQEDAKKALADGHTAIVAGAYTRRDFAGGQMSRDMTLFVDPDDAKGYLIGSAEENYTLNIHELTDDYLDFTGKWARIVPGGHNEAPALIKQDGKYHLLTSGCTGWIPNDARSFVSDSVWGPWTYNGNPCVGMNPRNGLGPEKTWGGQSTFILPVPNKPGQYIAMFDEWRPRRLTDSGYIWLPVTLENGKMRIQWSDKWSLK